MIEGISKDGSASVETENEGSLKQVVMAHEGGGAVFPSAGLLEACRTKWQYGNWTELATLPEERMQSDPDRGKVAILGGCGPQPLWRHAAGPPVCQQGNKVGMQPRDCGPGVGLCSHQ